MRGGALAVLIAACGGGSAAPSPDAPLPAAPDASIPDAAAPGPPDATPPGLTLSRESISEALSGDVRAPSDWPAVALVALADPATVLPPASLAGGVARWDQAPAGPYFVVETRGAAQTWTYLEGGDRSATFATVTLADPAAYWPAVKSIKLQAQGVMAGGPGMNLVVSSVAAGTRTTQCAVDGTLPSVVCKSAPAAALPFGPGTKLMVRQEQTQPTGLLVAYFLATPGFNDSSGELFLAGTLTSAPTLSWSWSLDGDAFQTRLTDAGCGMAEARYGLEVDEIPRATTTAVIDAEIDSRPFELMRRGPPTAVSGTDTLVTPPGTSRVVAAHVMTAECETHAYFAFPGPPSLAPILGPPHDVKVAGMDATHNPANVGATPELSWQPPTSGIATAYLVELAIGATTLHVRLPGSVTSFRLLPGWTRQFTPVTVAGIRALSTATDARLTNRWALPAGWATSMAFRFTP